MYRLPWKNRERETESGSPTNSLPLRSFESSSRTPRSLRRNLISAGTTNSISKRLTAKEEKPLQLDNARLPSDLLEERALLRVPSNGRPRDGAVKYSTNRATLRRGDDEGEASEDDADADTHHKVEHAALARQFCLLGTEEGGLTS